MTCNSINMYYIFTFQYTTHIITWYHWSSGPVDPGCWGWKPTQFMVRIIRRHSPVKWPVGCFIQGVYYPGLWVIRNYEMRIPSLTNQYVMVHIMISTPPKTNKSLWRMVLGRGSFPFDMVFFLDIIRSILVVYCSDKLLFGCWSEHSSTKSIVNQRRGNKKTGEQAAFYFLCLGFRVCLYLKSPSTIGKHVSGATARFYSPHC